MPQREVQPPATTEITQINGEQPVERPVLEQGGPVQRLNRLGVRREPLTGIVERANQNRFWP